MEFCADPADYARLIEAATIRLSRDEWERIAYILTIAIRTDFDVGLYLNSGVPKPLKQVLIRQLLARGSLDLIRAVVRWLEEPGGVGGTAISDAILATGCFDAAYGISEKVVYHLGSAQRNSMLSALAQTAATPSEKAGVTDLAKRAKE